jgi:hypothetical protein
MFLAIPVTPLTPPITLAITGRAASRAGKNPPLATLEAEMVIK